MIAVIADMVFSQCSCGKDGVTDREGRSRPRLSLARFNSDEERAGSVLPNVTSVKAATIDVICQLSSFGFSFKTNFIHDCRL